MSLKILFILKRREIALPDGVRDYNSGLSNSVEQLRVLLTALRTPHRVELAVDGNCIDRLVTLHRPTHVILEAIWCPPYKVEELRRLHPTVRWLCRIHSNTEFMAGEGMALEWLTAYCRLGVTVAPNSRPAVEALSPVLGGAVAYLPNYYQVAHGPSPEPWLAVKRDARLATISPLPEMTLLEVGCTCAIRPFKNTLNQARAALKVADEMGARLRFHVNSARQEGGGQANYKNLVALFASQPRHQLVEIDWLPPADFKRYLRRLDAVLQVSLSETFNIVTADAIDMGVPVVVSPAISWLRPEWHANPLDVGDIARALRHVLSNHRPHINADQVASLHVSNQQAEAAWKGWLDTEGRK